MTRRNFIVSIATAAAAAVAPIALFDEAKTFVRNETIRSAMLNVFKNYAYEQASNLNLAAMSDDLYDALKELSIKDKWCHWKTYGELDRSNKQVKLNVAWQYSPNGKIIIYTGAVSC